MDISKRSAIIAALSDQNPVYAFFRKKRQAELVFGSEYEISWEGGSFQVLLERGRGGVIFDIHGGGYLFGSHRDEDHFCHFLHERTGLNVVSCYYDLSSRSRFPTQPEQIYHTVDTICRDPAICTDRIFLMGASAGGNAAAAVTLMALDRGGFRVDGNILAYPVLDLACDPKSRPRVKGNTIPASLMEAFNICYFGSEEDALSPYASPLLASSEQLRAMPPTYLLTCAKDALRIDGLRYARRLQEEGVRVEAHEADAVHGFLENGMNNYYGKPLSESEAAAREAGRITDWICVQLSSGGYENT